jgi:hypothetical protein
MKKRKTKKKKKKKKEKEKQFSFDSPPGHDSCSSGRCAFTCGVHL